MEYIVLILATIIVIIKEFLRDKKWINIVLFLCIICSFIFSVVQIYNTNSDNTKLKLQNDSISLQNKSIETQNKSISGKIDSLIKIAINNPNCYDLKTLEKLSKKVKKTNPLEEDMDKFGEYADKKIKEFEK